MAIKPKKKKSKSVSIGAAREKKASPSLPLMEQSEDSLQPVSMKMKSSASLPTPTESSESIRIGRKNSKALEALRRPSTTEAGPLKKGSLSAALEKKRIQKSRVGSSRYGIAPGDYVRFTWHVDPASGEHTRSFDGYVKEIDGDWVRAEDKFGVKLYHPLTNCELMHLA